MELEISKKLSRNLDIDISKEKQAFDKVIVNVIDKGTDYILKAMPIQENIKDILIDVKKSFKTKDFSKIVQTTVTSSIREGLEILGAPINVIKDINKVKEAAFKGGLRQGLVAAVDIVSNKYIKGNIFGDTIVKFIDDTKDFINSKRFNMKIDEDIRKIAMKQEKFRMLCSEWYKAYDKMDLISLNDIAKKISNKQKTSVMNNEVMKAAKIILNMTEFVNNKKDKLSLTQLDVCKSI
jgi:hypothetical protein